MPSSINYYLSSGSDNQLAYCNGAEMDGAGYKRTLAREIILTVPGNLSTEDRIKTTLRMAAADSNGFSATYTRVENTTVSNGVATLRPAGGFAGSSIFMCAWKPFVEKNLEQFPEVKHIEWLPQS